MMKKYLIAGLLAFVCNGLLTGCSEDINNYGNLEEEKKAQFADNFEKFYGKISPTQDWGFNNASVAAARGMTRGLSDNSCGTCIKPDMTNYPSANAPADITDSERAYVKNWFETHPGFTTGLNISNFYVQHVYGEASKDYKVWYNHYDPNYKANHNGATSNYYRDDYWDKGTIDYLSVGDGTNYTHLNDFNSNDAGTKWKTIYMENSSALSFKYHCSWSDEEFTYFKCAEIDVPGIGKGWYVGMCMYGEKYDNGDRKINKEQKDLEYADDWIVKVIPGNGTASSTNKTTKIYKKKTVLVHKWVFCEDLGSSASNKDYDYNDLVFDAKIIDECKVTRDADGNETSYTDDPSHSYYAEVTPLAAGGELMIKFNAFSNTAHYMFTPATEDNIMINTCRFNQEISTPHIEALPSKTERMTFASADDANLNNIAIVVRSSQVVYDLSAYAGEAPHKICVPAGTRWAYERTDIKDAYTGFRNYVQGGTEPWSTTGVEENLYPLEGVSYEMKTDQTGTVSYEELSSSSSPVYNYTLVDALKETILWDGILDFGQWDGNSNIALSGTELTNAEIGNGTIIRIYGIANGSFNIKAVYQDSWDDPNLGDADWITGNDHNHYSASSLYGCVELKLNTTTANKFKSKGMRLYGNNFKALCVTCDNSKKVADVAPTEVLWTGYQNIGWDLSITIAKNKFANASSTSIIRFYGNDAGGWKQLWLKTDSWQDITNFFNGSSLPSTGYVDFVIGNYLSTLQSNNICIQGSGITLTKVELIP